MLTKICIKCKIEKEVSKFYFRKDSNCYRIECKKCCNLRNKKYNIKYPEVNKLAVKKYLKKYPWKLTYRNLRSRCNNLNDINYKFYGGRGIKAEITVEELKILWLRDKAYEMIRPSIDCEDKNKDYTFNNCRYMELRKNIFRNQIKSILQFDIQENFIKEWNSISEAAKYYNTPISNISSVLRNTSNTASGFVWKYKNV